MFKTALNHLKRSPYQSLAVILIMSAAFFVIGLFTMLAVGSESILKFLESRPQVTAFLKEEIKPQQIELLKTKLESTDKVKAVKYISKEEALEIYKKEIKDNPLLLEMVTAKILPASLEISATSLAALPEIAETLKQDSIVEEVLFQEDVVTALSSLTSGLRKTGIFLISFLILVSLLTVAIVIGMKVSQHKEEVEILGLIGATKWYTRSPFLVEGIIYGLISALLSWLACYILLLYTTPFLVKFLTGIPLFPVPLTFIAAILVGLLVLGILIGGVGSFLAVRRFFKSGR